VVFLNAYLFPILVVTFIWEHLFRFCYDKNRSRNKIKIFPKLARFYNITTINSALTVLSACAC
jgi:hypothetical protein